MTTLLNKTALKSSKSDILGGVRREDCSLAIWERAPMKGADALIAGDIADLRMTAPIDGLNVTLSAEMVKAGYPAIRARDELTLDIVRLAEIYGQIIEASAAEVRVEVVTTDSCRKWHADYVSARLITTYAGTGTDWLDEADVERVKQGLEPIRINTLGTGDVGVFKGKLATGEPAIHRSPPIAGTGEKRLLVVLNPPVEA